MREISLSYIFDDQKKYKKVRIPKGKMSYRHIYIPSEEYRDLLLRKFIDDLHHLQLIFDDRRVIHGFFKGRNCVTNALAHVGFEYTISLDLESFFDSVRPHHVEWILPPETIHACFIEGAPRQGLPTSPAIANIAMIPYDNLIIDQLEKITSTFSYTRYADDITISVEKRHVVPLITAAVNMILLQGGFQINNRKTRIQSLKNGKKIITGIAVDRSGVSPSRRTKRKIRAAYHQKNIASTRGLEEWAKCKLPRLGRSAKKSHYHKLVSKKPASCRHCGEAALLWALSYGDRRCLIRSSDFRAHKCAELNTPTREELAKKIMIIGYKKTTCNLKGWIDGYFTISNAKNKTACIAIKKNGFDFIEYEGAYDLSILDSESLESLPIYEHTSYEYRNNIGSLHDTVLEKAELTHLKYAIDASHLDYLSS